MQYTFPCGSAGKESACNAGDLASIPGLGRSPGEGKGDPLQDSGLENSMDSIVHGVTKSQPQLINFHSLLSNRMWSVISAKYPNFHGYEKSHGENVFPGFQVTMVSVGSAGHKACSHINQRVKPGLVSG